MKPDDMASREAFEQWVWDYGLILDKYAQGSYRSPYTQTAWDAWQAALAFADKRTPEYPASPAEIADYLDDLSLRMRICGAAMQNHAEGTAALAQHGQEMAGAADIAQGWAVGIRAEMAQGSDA